MPERLTLKRARKRTTIHRSHTPGADSSVARVWNLTVTQWHTKVLISFERRAFYVWLLHAMRIETHLISGHLDRQRRNQNSLLISISLADITFVPLVNYSDSNVVIIIIIIIIIL